MVAEVIDIDDHREVKIKWLSAEEYQALIENTMVSLANMTPEERKKLPGGRVI